MRCVATLIALILIAAAAVGCEHTTQAVTTAPVSTIRSDGTTTAGVTYPDNYHADQKADPAALAKLHFSAGEVAEGQGFLDRAVDQYRVAVRLVPTHQEALYRLGMILTAERKPDAPAVWQQYVAATGGTAAAYSDLGFALDLADRPAEAAAAFKAGISKDAGCEPCRVNYARLLARTGDLDAAAAQLAAVLTPAEVQFDMGAVLEAEGDKPAAADRYHKALELDPTLSDATVRLAALK